MHRQKTAQDLILKDAINVMIGLDWSFNIGGIDYCCVN